MIQRSKIQKTKISIIKVTNLVTMQMTANIKKQSVTIAIK